MLDSYMTSHSYAVNYITFHAVIVHCLCIDDVNMISTCVGCQRPIIDQYIMRVSPDLEWHVTCLRCAECHQPLDESCTCFVRNKKTYCKQDYFRCDNFSKY